MSELQAPWLVLAVAAPLLAALVALLPLGAHRLRWIAVLACALALGSGAAAEIERTASGGSAVDPLGGPLLLVDALGGILVPFAALLALVLQLAAPRAWLTARRIRRGMIALAILIASFSITRADALAILWTLAMLPLWLDLRDAGPAGRQTARLFAWYMTLAVLCLGAGVALIRTGHAGPATVLVLVAVLIRKGIVPFHSWMPAAFEQAPLASSTLFSAPQLGAYVAVRLLAPSAPETILLVMGSVALFTAVYGAGLATVQREGRRAYGFLFMSQSALVVVGLDCTSEAGLAGGLVWWLASGLSLTGHGIAFWLLEARRGSVSLREHAGGYDRLPALATSFLILGLASVGFPFTLGFVGGELLVGGAVERFPHAGFAVVVAAGLNAITVVRVYFRLFCGKRVDLPGHQRLRGHERVAIGILIIAIIGGGLWPRPIVDSRARAAADVLATRARLAGAAQNEKPPKAVTETSRSRVVRER